MIEINRYFFWLKH